MRFIPRLTAPEKTDRHFINYGKGGYNTCISINKETGYVLPNCVGYAQGRLLELRGENKADWKLPACNAEDWFDAAGNNGMSVGQTPKLGSVVCWRAGNTHNSADGAGHVAVVEEIKPNGDIVVSQSAYGGQEFYISTLTKASGYAYAANRPLVGFIYCGIEFENDEKKVQDSTMVCIKAGLEVKLRSVHCYSSETALSSYGIRSGSFYLWDDTVKNGRIRVTNAENKAGIPGQVSFWVKLDEIGLFDKEDKKTGTGNETLISGTKCVLNNVPVYGTEKGPSIGRRSGTYYTWDSTVRNGRIRMTNNQARVGVPGQVSFWIEVNKL